MNCVCVCGAGNSICAEGAAKLAEALAVNTSITSINLGGEWRLLVCAMVGCWGSCVDV